MDFYNLIIQISTINFNCQQLVKDVDHHVGDMAEDEKTQRRKTYSIIATIFIHSLHYIKHINRY